VRLRLRLRRQGAGSRGREQWFGNRRPETGERSLGQGAVLPLSVSCSAAKDL